MPSAPSDYETRLVSHLYQAWSEVEGKEVPIYGLKEEDGGKLISGYIEAITGKKYQVKTELLGTDKANILDVYADGDHVARTGRSHVHIRVDTVWSPSVAGARSGKDICFGELKPARPGDTLTPTSNELGIIKVKIFKGVQGDFDPDYIFQKRKVGSYKRYDEETTLRHSHETQFGDERNVIPSGAWEFENTELLQTFKFFYKPQGLDKLHELRRSNDKAELENNLLKEQLRKKSLNEENHRLRGRLSFAGPSRSPTYQGSWDADAAQASESDSGHSEETEAFSLVEA
ncbi:hypothetical protein T439DRAFT_363047 [Meredithblackwellia eburnea MCA 4105]